MPAHASLTARAFAIVALVAISLAFAFVHPEYPHALLFIYVFWPGFVVVGTFFGVIGRLAWDKCLSPLFDGSALGPAILFVVVDISIGFLVNYASLCDRVAWSALPPETTALVVDVSHENDVQNAPALDASLLRKNFFGYNDPGWSFVRNKEQLVVVPRSGFYLESRGILPVMIPEWTGDFLVHADGTVEELSPAQALRDPRLQDIPLYPASLLVPKWIGYESTALSTLFTSSSGIDPILIRTATDRYWAMPIDFGEQKQFSRFLAVNAHTGKLYVARFRFHVGADPAEILPVYSDGAWQPNQFLIANGHSDQARLVTAQAYH